MRHGLFLLLVCAALSAEAQTITVPDANFRNFLDSIPGTTVSGNTITFTTPSAASITSMDCSGRSIADLTGIAAFTGLTFLKCSSNQLTSLDVSANTALQILLCNNNQLDSLDVRANTALQYLDCGGNRLTSLDVSANTALQTLYCYDNQLDSLDVRANTALQYLYCYDNQLDSLDVRANTALRTLICSSNQLTSLDVSANTALQILLCDDNQLTSLDVSANTALQYLSCGGNQLDSLDVRANTALQTLYCSSNQLTSLDVRANTALTQLGCAYNQLDSLDVRANTALQYLSCGGNRLTSLDMSANTALTQLGCYNNQLTSLDMSANTALTELYCFNNQLTSLDMSANTALTELRCENNRIPIILTSSTPITTLIKDPITQVAVFRSASGTPSISAAQTGGFVLGTTGAIVNITANTGPAGGLSSSTGTNPTIVSSLPSGIVRLSPDKFWTVAATSLTGVTYNLILDMRGISGITNFNTLKVLKRANSSSAWQDVSQPPISATVQYLEPFILVSGLTSFSDFAIGSIGDNPLPVELTEFGFRKADFGIELVWKTASEKNNAGFEVQRRSEKQANEEWQVLGFVRGAGTTSDAKNYSFVDRTATGKVQYRLKQVDFDGQFEYSPVVEVEAGLPRTFELGQNYPNPFNPTTLISYQLPVASEVSLKVYDVLGREVATLVNGRQEAGRYSVSFNAASFASGVYFYRLQAGQFVQTRKMMLVK